MTPDTKRYALTLGVMTLCASLAPAAHAYVGPGAGLGLLTALWGLVAAVGVAVFYVVMWPIRRMRRRRKAEREATQARPADTDAPVVQMRQPTDAPSAVERDVERKTGTGGPRG